MSKCKSSIIFSLPNPVFDLFLEFSLQNSSNKWTNLAFGEEVNEIRMNKFECVYLILELCGNHM